MCGDGEFVEEDVGGNDDECEIEVKDDFGEVVCVGDAFELIVARDKVSRAARDVGVGVVCV